MLGLLFTQLKTPKDCWCQSSHIDCPGTHNTNCLYTHQLIRYAPCFHTTNLCGSKCGLLTTSLFVHSSCSESRVSCSSLALLSPARWMVTGRGGPNVLEGLSHRSKSSCLFSQLNCVLHYIRYLSNTFQL